MRYIFLVCMMVSFSAFAQKGTIRGTVIEDANGEPLFGVTVQIKGTTNGAITDFEGKFEIQTAPGSYDLQASFVSFETVTITGLNVESEGVTLIDQIRLKEDVELLDEVVVTAEVIKTTEAALMTVKRKSASLVDGISAASFRKIGDSDAASAAKRITGVSIEGGKYVYVRGLGDRYTKTLLNGMDVPGLDPDKNALQMDIFPTNVLNNIIVSKTFTADLPADFTGGLVDIETKDVPDVKTADLQIGFAYNPSMHFNGDYLTYNGSKTDWLGFDDGTRDLHINDNEIFDLNDPNFLSDQEQAVYAQQLSGFNKEFTAVQKPSFMDFNFGFGLGNQRALGKGTLGYNIALTYKNTTDFFDDALFARYRSNTSMSELELLSSRRGSYGVNNVLLGGMVGTTYKIANSKFKFNILRLQNGESSAGEFSGRVEPIIGTDLTFIQNNLEYSEKQLTNLLIGGEHYMNAWTVEWKVSPTFSKINDPDIRFAKYEVLSTGGFEISAGNTDFPRKIWRDLDEINVGSRIDVTREYNLLGESAKLKMGIGNTYKSRDFAIREFIWTVNQTEFTGDFNEIGRNENMWPNENGNFFTPAFIGGNTNQYSSSSINNAFYISNEFYPLPRFKAIIGLRGEAYTQFYTGTNQSRTQELDNDKVIEEFNLFPSTNFVYELGEKMNLRFSYNRTIARYSFKEASFIEYFDPLTNRTFLGGLNPLTNGDEVLWDGNIESTLIDNFDVRWERFADRGQILSVSAFYKMFNNPIEIVQIALAQGNFQPQNVGDAVVYGVEFEFRKNLDMISPSLSNFYLNGNTTFSVSQITMTDQEFDSRNRTKRANEVVDRERQLQGQAPYILNGGLAYDNYKERLEVGLYYNVQGPTLAYTGGVFALPDVYTVPFHSLNFSAIKSLGENDKMRLTLRVNNILNAKREWEYQSFDVSDQLFESRSPGTSVSVGFKYSIN